MTDKLSFSSIPPDIDPIFIENMSMDDYAEFRKNFIVGSEPNEEHARQCAEEGLAKHHYRGWTYAEPYVSDDGTAWIVECELLSVDISPKSILTNMNEGMYEYSFDMDEL